MRSLLCLIACAVLAAEGHPEGTLLLKLGGPYPLQPGISLPDFRPGLSRHEVCIALRKALRAPERRLVLDCSEGLLISRGTAEALATELRRRDEGRQVSVLFGNMDDTDLVLAAACDEALICQTAIAKIDGLHLAQDYYATALEKLGVRVHAVASGPPKDGP